MKKILNIIALVSISALALPVIVELVGKGSLDSVSVEGAIVSLTACFAALLSMHDYGRSPKRFQLSHAAALRAAKKYAGRCAPARKVSRTYAAS